MIAFGAILNATQQAHGCVAVDIVRKLHKVEIFDRNPTIDGTEKIIDG
jgi:hypothetical protein